ncbi:MAG: PadR family transcriptional regulator [Propioniciclava sp.]
MDSQSPLRRLPGFGARRTRQPVQDQPAPVDPDGRADQRSRRRGLLVSVPPVRNRSGRARKGDVRRAILCLLAEQPMNGYEIITTFAQRSEGLWQPSPGAVYPALAQLQDQQLITEAASHDQRGFRLTAAGREAARGLDAPWETVTRRAGASDGQDPALAAYERLGTAVRASRRAAPEHRERVGAILEDARRSIDALLNTPRSPAG